MAYLLIGTDREVAQQTIREHHYLHSVPSGKSHYFRYQDGFIVYSIPANPYIAQFLLGNKGGVWELSRMWAPDDHHPNLLTGLISATISEFRGLEPGVLALVAYADPNVGHEGYVYRAASWCYCGQCQESRCYIAPSGQVVARRRFHSGGNHLRKAEIEALGYTETRLPGKHRYAKGLTRWARKEIERRFGECKSNS